ncbi:hypothetical protein F4809DRAFT_510496 [Biscogniauxia mediterranea]|nr:hypothetical protein F4809DRAFT_510496 [Biscogniauxia mediterranea]
MPFSRSHSKLAGSFDSPSSARIRSGRVSYREKKPKDQDRDDRPKRSYTKIYRQRATRSPGAPLSLHTWRGLSPRATPKRQVTVFITYVASNDSSLSLEIHIISQALRAIRASSPGLSCNRSNSSIASYRGRPGTTHVKRRSAVYNLPSLSPYQNKAKRSPESIPAPPQITYLGGRSLLGPALLQWPARTTPAPHGNWGKNLKEARAREVPLMQRPSINGAARGVLGERNSHPPSPITHKNPGKGRKKKTGKGWLSVSDLATIGSYSLVVPCTWHYLRKRACLCLSLAQ